MRCPSCGSPDTQVTDTRMSDDGLEIRRRRRCLACDRRFKTIERLELSLPVVVKKEQPETKMVGPYKIVATVNADLDESDIVKAKKNETFKPKKR